MIGDYSLGGFLLTSVLALVAAFVLYPLVSMAIIIWKSKQNLEFYRKQGGVIHFYPLSGPLGLEGRNEKENRKGSNYNKNLKIAAENPGAQFTATNMVAKPSCVIQIHNSELLKEFLIKEDLFLKKAVFDEFDDVLGFFFHNGEKAFKSKAVFTKIFQPEEMEAFTPKICKIIQAIYARVEKKHGINKDTYVKFDLDEIFWPIFDAITELVIFGKETLEPNEDMQEIRRLHYEMIHLQRDVTLSPIFNLLPWLTRKLNLVPGLRRFDEIMKRQTQLIEKIITEREKSGVLGQCIIDRVIRHNRECKATGKTEDILSMSSMAGQYNIFQIAGAETSKATSKTAVCMMADKPHIKQWWQKVVDQIYDQDGLTTQDKINNCEDMQLCTKEVLRMHVPLPRLFLKQATKDISLGNLVIKKDDYITVQIAALNYSPIHFKEPYEFKPERFKKEEEKKLPKYQFIPFSVGKRVCMGRYLGELQVQLLITQFVRAYEFRKPEGVDYYQFVFESLAVENPLMEVKKKF